MDFSLRHYYCTILICVFAFASLPVLAADMRPTPRRIRILKPNNIGENTPNIIVGQRNIVQKNGPLPKHKPEQIEQPSSNKGSTQEEVKINETDKEETIIKTLKLGSSKDKIVQTTKHVKTTREKISLAKPQEQKQPPATRSVSLSTSPSFCSEDQHNDIVKAAMFGHPHTNSKKDMGLAVSLRTYMKANKRNPEVIDALYIATQETGVSFELMAIKAMTESDLGAHTIAKNSSARGVFQYIDSTWLSLIKRHGDKVGYASYASALEYDPISKHFNTSLSSNVPRETILNLRNDNKTAALIKAYQIIDEQAVLKEYKEGKAPTITDHYIMHMLGVPLSRTFYRLKNNNSPIIPASLRNGMFDNAIAQNPSFFYDDNKNALNASQIYVRFAKTTGTKIDALREIDQTYGSGQNVVSQSCTPIPVRPNVHTPSFHNASTSSAVSKIEPAAGVRPKQNNDISSIALLQFEPTPITIHD